MKRKVLVIGIGAGSPDYVTMQAVDALNRANVLFIPDKGANKQDLARLRREICDRFIRDPDYRTVSFEVPERGKSSPTYRENVAAWRSEVEKVYERLLTEELTEEDCGAFLVWGDPSLYDGTLRILARIQSKGGFDIDWEVIPGISSIQALAAKHKVALNQIGQSIMITPGRRLADGMPAAADNVVVMLDGETAAFSSLDDDVDIHWGAYVGTEDEILLSGRLREVAGEIDRLRRAARARKGWIMDTYLLTRRSDSEGD